MAGVAPVGFIGLGAMGKHMARHIQKVHPTAVWNRTAAKAHEHAEEFGTIPVQNVSDLRCEVVFCCVSTSSDVEDLAKQLDGRYVKLLVDCTSGDPERTQRIGEMLAKKNIKMVDAPISGGPRGAEAGTLTTMFGGDTDAVNLAMKYAQFAKKKEHCGGLGAGHAIKAVNNSLNMAHLLIATEGLLTLQKFGVSPDTALKVINSSSGRSLQTEVRIPEEVVSRKFNYGFKLGLMVKDCKIGEGLVSKYFPQSSILSPLFTFLKQINVTRYDEDYTAACKVLEEKAGVELKPIIKGEEQETSTPGTVVGRSSNNVATGGLFMNEVVTRSESSHQPRSRSPRQRDSTHIPVPTSASSSPTMPQRASNVRRTSEKNGVAPLQTGSTSSSNAASSFNIPFVHPSALPEQPHQRHHSPSP